MVIIKEEAKEGWFVSFQTFGVHLPKVCLAVFFQEKKKKTRIQTCLRYKKKGENWFQNDRQYAKEGVAEG